MDTNQRLCETGRIELFLNQQLGDREQAEFEVHLDGCDACCCRLEEQAASGEVWTAIRESLHAEEPLLMPGDSPTTEPDAAANGDDPSFCTETVLQLLSPTDDERMLGRLGSYEVMGVIGAGGMGVVLKAFDPALNRYVAIKILSPHLGNSGAARKRFAREAQAAAAVVHDNVIEIHGVADAGGLPYLVMPYVRGVSLQRRLHAQGPLSVVEVLRIAMQAAEGLAEAHAQGLVHRDVKPANILLADGVERVKLTDFGLARAADDASLTKTGVIAGTPQFMSPEQARGEAVNATCDLFGLGSVIYAMCTGRAPFRAETSYGILRRITDTEPRPIRETNPDVPEWLCAIVAKLMAKQPLDRFESAREVAELLESCLAHVQQPATVALPESVERLVRQRSANQRHASSREARSHTRRSSRFNVGRLMVGTAIVLALVLAAVVIVLETGKGRLTIESEFDNVPIRIMQGEDVVEELTVTKAGATVRVAAGQYVVEIDGSAEGMTVSNQAVTLTRGGSEVVTIKSEHVRIANDGTVIAKGLSGRKHFRSETQDDRKATDLNDFGLRIRESYYHERMVLMNEIKVLEAELSKARTSSKETRSRDMKREYADYIREMRQKIEERTSKLEGVESKITWLEDQLGIRAEAQAVTSSKVANSAARNQPREAEKRSKSGAASAPSPTPAEYGLVPVVGTDDAIGKIVFKTADGVQHRWMSVKGISPKPISGQPEDSHLALALKIRIDVQHFLNSFCDPSVNPAEFTLESYNTPRKRDSFVANVRGMLGGKAASVDNIVLDASEKSGVAVSEPFQIHASPSSPPVAYSLGLMLTMKENEWRVSDVRVYAADAAERLLKRSMSQLDDEVHKESRNSDRPIDTAEAARELLSNSKLTDYDRLQGVWAVEWIEMAGSRERCKESLFAFTVEDGVGRCMAWHGNEKEFGTYSIDLDEETYPKRIWFRTSESQQCLYRIRGGEKLDLFLGGFDGPAQAFVSSPDDAESTLKLRLLTRDVAVVDFPEYKRPGGARLPAGEREVLSKTLNGKVTDLGEATDRASLLQVRGINESIADAILDWVDSDDEPREAGAECGFYESRNVPYAPSNTQLEFAEELLLVRGVTLDVLRQFKATRKIKSPDQLDLAAVLKADELYAARGYPNVGRALLMNVPGTTKEVADALLDWADRDREPREFGAEAEYYATLNPPVAVANKLPAKSSDLVNVRGMHDKMLRAFAFPSEP